MRDIQQSNSHFALLWTCAASYGAAAAPDAVETALSRQPIDWPVCVRMSMRHGVALLLASHLQALTGCSAVPADVSACLARMRAANARRNQVMFRECGRLIRALNAAGIRCLILKGVGLALTVYPQSELRNFADIDLLVAPSDLEAAGGVARDLGFKPEEKEADAHLLHQTFTTDCPEDILTETLPLEYEPDLPREVVERYSRRVVVEIHQGLFRDASGIARPVDSAPLREAPQQICLPDGTPGLLPSPEVMLVHLAEHAAGHGFARLMFFVDMALLLRHPETQVDWDCVVRLADRYEASRHLYRCLELVRREFNAPVPLPVLHRLARMAGGRRRISPLQPSDIFGAEREFGPGIVLQRLLLSQSPRQFMVALGHILFPPPVIMRRYYPARHPLALALFYLLRPFFLSGHLMQVLVRRVRYRH